MADPRLAELSRALEEIRRRVSVRHPSAETSPAHLPLVDLTPLLHARDAAESKVAAIGSVNPRPPGPLNAVVQFAKRSLARVLGWFVRDQIDFNRAALTCVQTTLDSLNEFNRLAVALNSRIEETFHGLSTISSRLDQAEETAGRLADIHVHWIEWRREWEHRLATNEVQFLRAVGDLESAYQQRMMQQEAAFREQTRAQHRDFEGALDRYGIDIQKRLWDDLKNVRLEFERLIHQELRVVRQHMVQPAPAPPPPPAMDQLNFGFRFRGDEDYVKGIFAPYAGLFDGRKRVLDVGCGRGEFLELARQRGIGATGVDSNPDSLALCRSKGLQVEQADLFIYLRDLPDLDLDGLFCAQVIEHLDPAHVPHLIRLAAAKLMPGAPVLFETPNPECLAIFATHFYLDPTHTRPVPASLMRFYLEEAGFGQIEISYRQPADPDQPLSAANALDYAISAVKL